MVRLVLSSHYMSNNVMSGRDNTKDDEIVCYPPNSPLTEANVPDSTPEDLVDTWNNRDLSSRGSDCDALHSGSGMNDTNPSRGDLLGCEVRHKFSSQRFAIENDGELNTLLYDETFESKNVT